MIIDFSNINGGGGGGYVLPIASDTTLGGIKVGSGVTIDSGGTISVSGSSYTLPTASSDTLGGVKIGSGVNIDSAGTISVDAIDPSTLKSVSALPLTAASGDVVVYDNIAWYYSPTTGSSVNITKSGKTIRAKYYNLPNGAKFPFPNEKVGQTPETGPWIEYNNGYFYFCWNEGGQIITAETFSMNSRWVIFRNTLEGVHSGSQTYGEMVFNFNDYNFSLYTEGNWPNQSAGHWEPLDWSSDFKPSLPVATKVDCGMVRIGNGVNVDSAGTISVSGFVPTSAMSGYVQTNRLATTGQTGLVQIGSGITVDENGVISASGGGGGGIEIVSELPASGYDGQTVMLVQHIPEKKLIVQPNISSQTLSVSVTAIGLTNAITVYNYEWYGARNYVTVNPDHSVDLYNDYDQQTTNYPVSADSYTYIQPNSPNNLTLTITETGFTIVSQAAIAKENIVNDIIQGQEEKETLYTWSDEPVLIADIDYTSSNDGDWCVRFKCSEMPQGTLMVWKYSYSEDYRHLVYENGQLKYYLSNSPTTITASTGTLIPQYSYVTERYATVYWTDDEVVVYKDGSSVRISINTDLFYKTGWHTESEHRVSNKAFYKDYVWYDKDYSIIVKHQVFPMYTVGLRINPTGQYNTPAEVYSRNNATIGPFFAPTTTGSTGQVCIAGNGWAAPTWTNPENLTNGVKFWKGTLDEYEALGGYDANTLYICTDE